MTFLIEGDWHHKNRKGVDLLILEGLEVDFEYNPKKNYDFIIYLGPQFKNYPDHNGIVIYGPQIELHRIIDNVDVISDKSYINLLSDWLVNLTNSIKKSDKYLKLPFPVDTDTFYPSKKTGIPIVYRKCVDSQIFENIKINLNFEYKIFDYSNRYDEKEFLEFISHAPFAIWIGRHESQGFAFQETLSCDTPIIVVDVQSLRDENCNGWRPWQNFRKDNDLKATAASYFDSTCGIITTQYDFLSDFDIFIKNLNKYEPRKFILENLSPNACHKHWIKTLSSL